METHQHWHKAEDHEELNIEDPDDIEPAELKSKVEILDLDLANSNQVTGLSKDISTNQDFSRSNPDLSKSNPDLSRSNQELSRSDQDFSRLSHDLSKSDPDIAESNIDLSESSHDFVRSSLSLKSHEDLSVEDNEDNEGERIRQADSVIAKVMSTEIFLLSSKKARRHRCRKVLCKIIICTLFYTSGRPLVSFLAALFVML